METLWNTYLYHFLFILLLQILGSTTIVFSSLVMHPSRCGCEAIQSKNGILVRDMLPWLTSLFSSSIFFFFVHGAMWRKRRTTSITPRLDTRTSSALVSVSNRHLKGHLGGSGPMVELALSDCDDVPRTRGRMFANLRLFSVLLARRGELALV